MIINTSNGSALFYILFFIIVFIVIFSSCFYCLLKNVFSKENLYLIIPAFCISLWVLYLLSERLKILSYGDFDTFYSSGKQIFIDPAKLYYIYNFYYLPSFAVVFAVSLSLLPKDLSYFLFLIINYILGILTIIEFNKILNLMNVKEKIRRFMFLMVISNGSFVYCQFFWNQTKYLVFLLLLLIIRRELQFIKIKKEKNLKYHIINYNLLVFAIGMAPYFFFFLLIYVFQDIPCNALFKKENIKKYSIAVMMFLIQNFLFFIYPSLIFDFLGGSNRSQNEHSNEYFLFYLREWYVLSPTYVLFSIIFCTIILFIITFILIFCKKYKKLSIEQKFGYFSIAYVLIGFQFIQSTVGIVLFTLITLLFIPYLIQDVKGSEFIKQNKILLIGLISIAIMLFIPGAFIITKIITEPEEYPLDLFYNLRWIFLLATMLTSLFSLHINENTSKNHENEILS